MNRRPQLLVLVSWLAGGCSADGPSLVEIVGSTHDPENLGGAPAETRRTNTKPRPSWPAPTAAGEEELPHTIALAGQTFDGGMKRYFGVGALGTDDQDEHQSPLFDLYDGAVLKNVILGAPAADGVHCSGSCTLQNVWWEDVGEDAATFLGATDDDVLLIEGGGARLADDKIFQHNGRGTLHIKDFHAESFGKVYRSCGNCDTQYPRRVIVENLTAIPWDASASIVGVNENYGDVAEFRGTSRIFDLFDTPICQRFEGNNASLEPRVIGDGPDGTTCIYDDSAVQLFSY